MKFVPVAAVLLAGLLFAPSVNAATTISTPAPMSPSLVNVYIPTPYVFPVWEQLRFLGYKASGDAHTSPTSSDRREIKRFQSKFNIPRSGKMDKRTVKALDKYAGNAELPKRCRKGGEFLICVNKFNRTVMAVNADGSVAKTMDSRFGMQGHETREGKFKVFRKGGANHISTLYKVEMPYPIFFSGGQAVHYSHEFARLPNTQSHGCVGTRDMTAQKWLWNHSPIGTPVIVFDKAPTAV